jgi:hypothetical protein
MGRKPNALITKETAAMEAMKITQEEADRLYGDGLPFDAVRVETKIATNNTTALDTMIESGRGYQWLKAYLDHGEFMEAVRRTSDSHTYVVNCMRFADTFPNSPPVANLGVRKARSIAMMDKPIVEEYFNGGPLGDIPHDDVAKMPVRELEEEVRKLRKKLDDAEKTRKQIIKQKNEKLDEMENKLNGQEPPTKEQLARAAVQRFRDPVIDNILEATERMRRAIAAIDEAQKVPDVPYEALEEMLDPWKESFNTFCDTAEDLTSAFNNIHIDKGRG